MTNTSPAAVRKPARAIDIAVFVATMSLTLLADRAFAQTTALVQLNGSQPMSTFTITPQQPFKTIPAWLDPGRGEYCRGFVARGAAVRGRLEHAWRSVSSDGTALSPAVVALLDSLNDALVGSDECPGAGGAPLPTVSADAKGAIR